MSLPARHLSDAEVGRRAVAAGLAVMRRELALQHLAGSSQRIIRSTRKGTSAVDEHNPAADGVASAPKKLDRHDREVATRADDAPVQGLAAKERRQSPPE